MTYRLQIKYIHTCVCVYTRVYPKVSGLIYNEIKKNNNKHSLKSKTKRHGGKIYYTDSQNSDTSAPSGTDPCHLQFSLQAASPETFGYTLARACVRARVCVEIERSQWPRSLRHVLSSTARTLESWFRIPLGAWICVRMSCVGRGLASG